MEVSEFPYQLVAFLDKEPEIGEPVYSGENGWYPQIALKRRFRVNEISEKELFSRVNEFAKNQNSLRITTGELIAPETMPVRAITVEPSTELIKFHNDFISFVGEKMTSRFPERDGANYFPHITAEFNDEFVIDVDRFTNKEFILNKVFLLKDVTGANSLAYQSFNLKRF